MSTHVKSTTITLRSSPCRSTTDTETGMDRWVLFQQQQHQQQSEVRVRVSAFSSFVLKVGRFLLT